MEDAARDEPGTWASLREAIRGTERDLTSVPIGRAVFLLAVPTVLEMSMESLLIIVDIFFVSKLGSDALATVGLTESMMSPVYALAMGLSAAATATIARRIGEKDPEAASVTAVQVLALALAAAAVLGIIGGASAGTLLGWMGASSAVVGVGATYTALMLAGNATVFLLFVVNAIFRSAGDAAIAMRSLWLANILNMLLAPCLIFGVGPIPRLGLLGAAVAMTASRAVGVAYQLAKLFGGRRRIGVGRRHLVYRDRVVAELARLATPATLQVLIETASWLGLVRIVATYGDAALAGYTIAMRVVIFALLPSWGLAAASATLVGQNLGAREPDRARRSVWRIAAYNVALLGPIGVVFVVAPHAIVRFFTEDPLVAQHAADCLRIVAIGFVAFAYGMVAMQSFNGSGDTRTPMLVNLGAFWGFKIPLAFVLAKVLGLGPRGVFIAICAAYGAQAVLAALLLRRAGARWLRDAAHDNAAHHA
jgi:MATE family, multidrug efflux pump